MKKLFFFTTLMLLPSCGRKNNNFLVFTPKEKIIKINKLTLPSVRGVRVEKTVQGATNISWLPVINPDVIGYNVYKFVPTAFIPRKPINKKLITQNSYLDKSKTSVRYCYLVRAVYLMHGKTVEGPTSKIVK